LAITLSLKEAMDSSLSLRKGQSAAGFVGKTLHKLCLPKLDMTIIPQLHPLPSSSQSERRRANMVQYDSDIDISMRMLEPFGVIHSDPATPNHSSSMMSGSVDKVRARSQTALAPMKYSSNQGCHETHNNFKRRVLSAPQARLKSRSKSMVIISSKQHESSQFSVPMHRVQRFMQSNGVSCLRSSSPSDTIRNHRPGNLLRQSFQSTSHDNYGFSMNRSDVDRAMFTTAKECLRND